MTAATRFPKQVQAIQHFIKQLIERLIPKKNKKRPQGNANPPALMKGGSQAKQPGRQEPSF